MSRKSKYALPSGASVQTDSTEAAPEPIRSQITQMSGFTDIDEVIAEAPESTQESTGPAVGPNGRRLKKDGTERAAKRRKVIVEDDADFMTDPVYKKHIGNMSFYGAPRTIKRSFTAVATLTHDPTLDLDDDEADAIDGYFYCLSKHMTFDPMASVVGRILLLIAILGGIVMERVLVRSAIGRQIKEMILGEPKTTALQDNRSVRPGSVGEDAFS